MKVLLVGDGAREHIISEQIARSAELYAVMGKSNPGIAKLAQKYFVCDFSNVEAIGSWVLRERIDAALVTSEVALAKGLVDVLADARIPVASPPSAATMVGENNVYAFNLMEAAGIAKPRLIVCKNEKELKNALKEIPRSVMKSGVRVEWKGTMFMEKDFAKKTDMVKYGKKMIKRHGSVIVRDMVDGEVFSLQAVTDGRTLCIMPPVRTAKRALEGEEGSLTEGMGSYSAGKLLPFMRQSDLDQARDALWKIIAALKAKGVAYKGPIGGKFIATGKGTLMLEVFTSFGRMETLNNLMVLRTQLAEVLGSIAAGSLKEISFLEKATVVKYLVPPGYPEKPKKNEIKIDERMLWNNGAKAYFESVQQKKGKLMATKDRSVAICASGQTVEEAEAKAEAAACSVGGKARHRIDIATKDYVGRSVKHMALLRSA